MLLNRRDLFFDLTSELYIASTLDGFDGLTVWNLLWQIIIGNELAMRLAFGLKWSTNDFTPMLLATLIVADQWLQNVEATKQDKGREDMKRKFIETSKKANEHSVDGEAEKWKNAGNTALARKDLNAAVSFYTLATVRCPKNAVYLTNRAAAYFRLNKFAEAEQDAKAAVDVDPGYAKAWSWLGAARLELGQYEASVDAYEWAIELGGDGGTVPMKDGLAKAKHKVTDIKDPGWVKLPREQQMKVLAENEWDLGKAHLRFLSLVHQRQTMGLVVFAELIGWPHVEEVREHTKDVYQKMLDGTGVSLAMWDWLYGLSLPGKWFSMKIGRALVSCTPSLKDTEPCSYYDAGISLAEGSYWRVRSVLGRVLGSLPRIRSVCGWVGPCPAISGPRSLFIRLKTDRVKPVRKGNDATRTGQHDLDSDKESMRLQRGENLEDWAKDIQDDSHWLIPKSPEQDNSVYLMRNIRLERLPLDDDLAATDPTASAAELGIRTPYRPSIEFQLGDGPRVSYNLNTNPIFVTLPPCYNAPNHQHPVHRREFPKYLRNIWRPRDLKNARPTDYESESVMVINATGHGAETLARAWCAERGKNAVIRRIGGPCFACAYKAASLSGLSLEVLIWVSSADHQELPSPCNVCFDNCLKGKISGRFRVTLEDVERSAERGCLSCEVLQRGIELGDKTPPSSEMPQLPTARLNTYLFELREGYTCHTEGIVPNQYFQNSDRVINGASERGCGLCITYVYRKTRNDVTGTVAEIDLFVKQGMTGSCPPPSALTLMLTPSRRGHDLSLEEYTSSNGDIREHSITAKLFSGPILA